MTTAILCNDIHLGSKLTYQGPHGTTQLDNGAEEYLTALITKGNNLGAALFVSNGDGSTLDDDFSSATDRATRLQEIAKDFHGQWVTGIGNHEPFWALKILGLRTETHTLTQTAFQHTDFIMAQPDIDIGNGGMEYTINPDPVVAEIERSTASNLLVIQHFSALRTTPQGFRTLKSPYGFTPNNAPIRDALEKKAQQGATIIQPSGDEHAYIERISPAGVRYLLNPAFTINSAQDPSKPSAIHNVIREKADGSIEFTFEKLERVNYRGQITYQSSPVPLAELTQYCKSKFDPNGFHDNFMNFEGSQEAVRRAHAALQP